MQPESELHSLIHRLSPDGLQKALQFVKALAAEEDAVRYANKPRPKLKAGAFRGMIHMAPDFDEPLELVDSKNVISPI